MMDKSKEALMNDENDTTLKPCPCCGSNAFFDIIYADPPWAYKDKANAGKRGAGHKYTVTGTEAI